MSTTNAQQSVVTGSKSNKKALGTLEAPIVVTDVYVKDIVHNAGDAKSWIVTAKDGRNLAANTYNGNLGQKATPQERQTVDTSDYEKLESGADLPAWIQWDNA